VSPVTRFKCVVCGKLTAGRLPRAHGRFPGDTTFYFPRRHKGADGKVCKGSRREAEWVDVDTKDN
jgi:hypothetical protein